MTMKTSRCASAQTEDAVRVSYSPDVVRQMQSLLAALADIDCAYESDLDTIRTSDTPEVLKQEVMRTLQQRHQERRASYVQQIEMLQRQVVAAGVA